jgi:hypothetical protein
MKSRILTAFAVMTLLVTGFIGATIMQGGGVTAANVGSEFVPVVPSERVYNYQRNAGTAWVKIFDLNNTSLANCHESVHVNITMSNPSAAGYATAYGQGSLPGTSLVNVTGAGDVNANAANIKTITSGGDVYIKVYHTVNARIIVDVFGSYRVC